MNMSKWPCSEWVAVYVLHILKVLLMKCYCDMIASDVLLLFGMRNDTQTLAVWCQMHSVYEVMSAKWVGIFSAPRGWHNLWRDETFPENASIRLEVINFNLCCNTWQMSKSENNSTFTASRQNHTSDWTLHSSMSGSKRTRIRIICVFMQFLSF